MDPSSYDPPLTHTERWIRAKSVSYGWGVIPVNARIGGTAFSTSLFPKDGRYLLPLRDAVRRAEGIGLNDRVAVEMQLRSA